MNLSALRYAYQDNRRAVQRLKHRHTERFWLAYFSAALLAATMMGVFGNA